MHRSVLLLLMSTLLLSAAVGLPLSLESFEESSLEQLLKGLFDNEEHLEYVDPSSPGHLIQRRAAKDSSSSSEEHKDKTKDKANSSGSSSSEEQNSTTDHAAEKESTTQESTVRRRRQTITKANIFGEPSYEENVGTTLDYAMEHSYIPILRACYLWSRDASTKDNLLEYIEPKVLETVCSEILGIDIKVRNRRQVSGRDSDDVEQTSNDELELDAQAEKALDEEMARAVAEVKDNGSIEDYAQGCEVMEISSKEANEATYAK